jgi:ribosomal protein L40E
METSEVWRTLIAVFILLGVFLFFAFVYAIRSSGIETEEANKNTESSTKEKIFCRYCGFQNEVDAVYCKKCGKNIA